MNPNCFGIGAASALWLSGRNCPYFESCRRSGCFGQSRYLVSGVLIRSSFEIPWGARKNKKLSNILQRKLAFTNRISTALAQALP